MYGYGYPMCCNNSGYNDNFGASWIWIIIILFILFFVCGGFGYNRGFDR